LHARNDAPCPLARGVRNETSAFVAMHETSMLEFPITSSSTSTTMQAAAILDTLCQHLSTGIRDGFIELVAYGKGHARRESTENEVIIGKSLQAFATEAPLLGRHM